MQDKIKMSKVFKMLKLVWCVVFDQMLNGGDMVVKVIVGVSRESEYELELCVRGIGGMWGRKIFFRICISESVILVESQCLKNRVFCIEEKKQEKICNDECK